MRWGLWLWFCGFSGRFSRLIFHQLETAILNDHFSVCYRKNCAWRWEPWQLVFLLTTVFTQGEVPGSLLLKPSFVLKQLAGFFPAVPEPAGVLLTPGNQGPACFSSPAHLSTQFPLSLPPPDSPALLPSWLLFCGDPNPCPPRALFFRHLVLAVWHCGFPEPSSGTRSTMVSSLLSPWSGWVPISAPPRNYSSGTFHVVFWFRQGHGLSAGSDFPPPGTLRLLAGERVGWFNLGGVGRGRGCYGAQLTGRPKASTVPGARSTVVRVSEVLVRSFLEVATVSYACLYLTHYTHLPIVLEPTAPAHNRPPC